ncbi:MAG: hypothetical protein V1755_03035 [Chloroflexota bacterium]
MDLATLLVFFFATERYLADVVNALTLLSVTGIWLGCADLHSASFARAALGTFAALLSSCSNAGTAPPSG